MALLVVGLILLGVVLDRVWLVWRYAGTSDPLFDIEDAKADAVREIAARRRRAEEQMRRVSFETYRR
ncbi:hypothetical protein [Fodinicola acaciae]|uniref:hypothetical protein n=1 Tax=Fodinicola acaciae TaxID=2681555 RepID=UPI0013D4F558|nr:hypothetical protein [Fodinicola acaciae]